MAGMAEDAADGGDAERVRRDHKDVSCQLSEARSQLSEIREIVGSRNEI